MIDWSEIKAGEQNEIYCSSDTSVKYGFTSGSHKNEQSMETSLSSETYQLRERTPHMASTTVATVSSPQEEAETRITALEDASTTDDPQNWSALKKLCHIVPVASLVLAVTLGTSSISPAADQIAEEFEVSREAAILPFVREYVSAVLLKNTNGSGVVYRWCRLWTSLCSSLV